MRSTSPTGSAKSFGRKPKAPPLSDGVHETPDVVGLPLGGRAVDFEPDGGAVAVVVEHQIGYDHDKRFSWPAYLTTLCLRLKCTTVLMVLCPNEVIAHWCATPIPMGHPGFDLAPLAIGPSDMPVVMKSAQARAILEIAVFSAPIHGNSDSRALKAVVEALDARPGQHRLFHYALAGLNETARNVIAVLEARGFTISPEIRERTESRTDLGTLEKWVPQAVTNDRPGELFS